ncbi:MAG: nucleotide exchange factor GrpE [Clostridia bacterium]|nr:nucleotide exchange factor GrpE [Clostridia bacterium]
MNKKKTQTEVSPEVAEKEAAAEETAEENTLDERDAIIEELNKKLLEANDKYLRTVAEYDNFRKRSQKEKEAIFSDSKTDIIGKLLPVIDNFERAASAETDLESYKKGIEMTVNQLLDVFKSLGVEAYGEKGEEFDPNIHNGVMHIDDETLGENVISDVYMKGYKMGDKVIRHATVIVAN